MILFTVAVIGEFDLVGRIFANMASNASDMKKATSTDKTSNDVVVQKPDNSGPKDKEISCQQTLNASSSKAKQGGSANASTNKPKAKSKA